MVFRIGMYSVHNDVRDDGHDADDGYGVGHRVRDVRIFHDDQIRLDVYNVQTFRAFHENDDAHDAHDGVHGDAYVFHGVNVAGQNRVWEIRYERVGQQYAIVHRHHQKVLKI